MTDQASRASPPGDAFKGYRIEDLHVGMTADLARTIVEDDLHRFADLCGDHNPVHFDEAYAATTKFKGRIVHGFLTASLVTAVLGTRLPGPGCIYLSQSLRFQAPVRIGDTVVARVTVTNIMAEGRRASLRTVCSVDDTVVIDGEALVMVPSRA